MMLHQNYDNRAEIDAMQTSSRTYYWVNVGVEKYFSTDLTEAAAYYATVGDSLYKHNAGDPLHWGELVLETLDAPQAYNVEVELVANDDADDSDQPENWISRQYGQMEARRVYRNACHASTIRSVYSVEGLKHTKQAIIRLCRSGAGTVEHFKVDIQGAARDLGIDATPLDIR